MNGQPKSQTRTHNWGSPITPVAAVPATVDHAHSAAGENFAAHLPVVVEPPAKLLFTVRECATMTSLSEKTILRLISRGKIRCVKSIRHKRVPRSELERFIRDD
jgi:excisionase family DNA binding protein